MNFSRPNKLKGDGMQRGFTLIELLIVIFIMMMLTVLAIMNYSAVQREARLDFSADSLVAAIREQQMMAKSGRVVADSSGGSVEGGAESSGWKNQCFALKFIVGEADNGMWSGQTDYVGIPRDGEATAIDSCKVVDGQGWMKREIFDSGIELKEILKNGSSVNDERIYFKPSFAKVYQDNSGVMSLLSNDEFIFKLGTRDSVRFVKYNVSTGEVNRVASLL